MELAVIKYNAGNIQSVSYALERLGVEANITDVPEEIMKADKVIFPGVGEASTTMNYLNETNLADMIKSLKQPVLGVCLGMQLMCQWSEENNTDCLNIFPYKVLKFKNTGNERMKIPHMGWNALTNLKGPLFKNVQEQEYTYFVHSYHVQAGDHSAAITDYIVPFSSAMEKDNFYAVQFHPEKSASTGEKIIQNFLDI